NQDSLLSPALTGGAGSHARFDKGTLPMQNYQRALLPNGIRLLTASLPHVRSISIAYYFGVGSRYERGEISGVSHFIEHMLFKGSQRYPTARPVSETIEGVGGVLDAETGKELTVH